MSAIQAIVYAKLMLIVAPKLAAAVLVRPDFVQILRVNARLMAAAIRNQLVLAMIVVIILYPVALAAAVIMILI
jgi:hypothetical protein